MLSFILLDCFQIVVFIVILYKYPIKEPVDQYIAIILIGGLLAIFSKVIFYYLEVSSNLIYTVSSTLCFAPMSHLYIREYLSQKKVSKALVMLHLLPFFLSVVFFVGEVITFSYGTSTPRGLNKFLAPIMDNIRTVSLVVYLFLNAFFITRYGEQMKKALNRVNGSIIVYFIVHKVFLLFIICLAKFGLNSGNFLTYIGLLSMPILFAVVIYYKVLIGTREKFKELYAKISEQVVKKPEDKGVKYAKSNLDSAKYDQLVVDLKNYMEIETPYLDMAFSTAQLASAIHISQHDLSMLVNQKLNTTFYEYINSYRIQYFMDNIQRVMEHETTVLALAYESGFSSKSTFNKYFRQEVGMPPTSYIKNLSFDQESKLATR